MSSTLRRWVKRVVPESWLHAYRVRRERRRAVFVELGDRESIFREIRQSNYWGSRESVSGPGSELSFTAPIREALPRVLRELGVRSLLDLPCGDWNWMRHVDLRGIEYFGGDIVPELIDANRAAFAGDSIRFERLDLIADPLPRVDLVFCRDCMIHLSLAEIRAALGNIAASGSTWLMATTYPDVRANHDIPTGLARGVNLELAPLRLPPPRMLVREGADFGAVKCMGVWRIDELPA